MTNKRKEELFNNMLAFLNEQDECDALYANLAEIGFTYKEMIECGVEFDEINAYKFDTYKCPKCKHIIFSDECRESEDMWRCPYCGKQFKLRDY